MINTEKFSKRLRQVMDYYQVSSATFADKIGVQRSSISHLLSGRNKPSLEFVLKVLENYKDVELYWLLNGKGNFPKQLDKKEEEINTIQHKTIATNLPKDREIDRIIIFYNDGSFENYTP